jgi:hypothetical protein
MFRAMTTHREFTLEPFDQTCWHQRQKAVYAAWCGLPRARGNIPARHDFDPFAVPEALGWIWLHDIRRSPLGFHCRLFGTLLANAVGVDIQGRWLEDTPLADPARPLDWARMRMTALDGRPSWARTRPILRPGDIWSEVESLLLPFASDGRTPDILMGVSTYYRRDGTPV